MSCCACTAELHCAQPYDPSKITGDATPNMPAPNNGKDCGGLGALHVIVVAIAVTVYTAGAAAAA